MAPPVSLTLRLVRHLISLINLHICIYISHSIHIHKSHILTNNTVYIYIGEHRYYIILITYLLIEGHSVCAMVSLWKLEQI